MDLFLKETLWLSFQLLALSEEPHEDKFLNGKCCFSSEFHFMCNSSAWELPDDEALPLTISRNQILSLLLPFSWRHLFRNSWGHIWGISDKTEESCCRWKHQEKLKPRETICTSGSRGEKFLGAYKEEMRKKSGVLVPIRYSIIIWKHFSLCGNNLIIFVVSKVTRVLWGV